jgi:hypothetical protein
VCVEQIESRVKSPEQSTSSRKELESEERLNKSGGAVLCCAASLFATRCHVKDESALLSNVIYPNVFSVCPSRMLGRL